MSEASVPPGSGDEWQHAGARIREARRAINMSARELASRVGVTPQHVSQVERGLGSFSASVLYSVATVLGISLDSLFGGAASPPTAAVRERSAELVLRRADRPAIQLRDGPRWERLTVAPEHGAEFLEVVYAPRTERLTDSGLTRHEGREYGVIIAGRLQVDIGFESTVLEVGDSVAFDSMIPHRFRNASDEETRAIWFVNENFRRAHGEARVPADTGDDPIGRRYDDHLG